MSSSTRPGPGTRILHRPPSDQYGRITERSRSSRARTEFENIGGEQGRRRNNSSTQIAPRGRRKTMVEVKTIQIPRKGTLEHVPIWPKPRRLPSTEGHPIIKYGVEADRDDTYEFGILSSHYDKIARGLEKLEQKASSAVTQTADLQPEKRDARIMEILEPLRAAVIASIDKLLQERKAAVLEIRQIINTCWLGEDPQDGTERLLRYQEAAEIRRSLEGVDLGKMLDLAYRSAVKGDSRILVALAEAPISPLKDEDLVGPAEAYVGAKWPFLLERREILVDLAKHAFTRAYQTWSAMEALLVKAGVSITENWRKRDVLNKFNLDDPEPEGPVTSGGHPDLGALGMAEFEKARQAE